jgi:para-nitrobenzyl esterase
MQASPLTRGLFQRAIGMSGAQIGGAIPLSDLKTAEQEGLKFQSLLKARSLADMRAMPADRLAPPRTPGAPAVGPNQDGYVLPQSIETIFDRGAQNDVPQLLGFTRDEAFGGLGPVEGLDEYRNKAQSKFGDLSAEFLQLYPASNDAEAKAQATAADRDGTMAVSMQSWSLAQTAHGKAPVYTYEFARPHNYVPGATFSDLNPATAGAYHTSEVPFWLGTLDSFNTFRTTRAWTAEDRTFTGEMTAALIRFARTGNPGSSTLDWPRFDRTNPQLMQLGQTAQSAIWPDFRKLDFFRKVNRPRPRVNEARD